MSQAFTRCCINNLASCWRRRFVSDDGWLREHRALAQLLTAGQPGTSGRRWTRRGDRAGSARARGHSCACAFAFACACACACACVPAHGWLQQWRGRGYGSACGSSTDVTCCTRCRRGRRSVEVQLLHLRTRGCRGHIPHLQALHPGEEAYEEAASSAPASRTAAHAAPACH